MTTRIGPHDLLPLKTAVRVGNQIGHVIKAVMAPAHGGGDICLHTIRFTHKVVYGTGRKQKYEKLKKPVIRTSNYAFINVLEDFDED